MFDERWAGSCGVCGWEPESTKELRQIAVRIVPGHRGVPQWESPTKGNVMLIPWMASKEEPESYRLFICEECARAAAEAWTKTPQGVPVRPAGVGGM
ncbi:MAG: hypothetical protein WC718_16350 [Phycisphaerales bacterium]|jgi:hypothetical protein